MIQVRKSIFETNSSSTHSLTICSKEDYDKLCREELFITDSDEIVGYDYIQKCFYDKCEDKGSYTNCKDCLEDYGIHECKLCQDDYIKTLDDYFEDEYLEVFEEQYTTEHGDEIVVFGKYGGYY